MKKSTAAVHSSVAKSESIDTISLNYYQLSLINFHKTCSNGFTCSINSKSAGDDHEADLEEPFEEPICQGSDDDFEPEDGEEASGEGSDDIDIISSRGIRCFLLGGLGAINI